MGPLSGRSPPPTTHVARLLELWGFASQVGTSSRPRALDFPELGLRPVVGGESIRAAKRRRRAAPDVPAGGKLGWGGVQERVFHDEAGVGGDGHRNDDGSGAKTQGDQRRTVSTAKMLRGHKCIHVCTVYTHMCMYLYMYACPGAYVYGYVYGYGYMHVHMYVWLQMQMQM